MSRLIAKYDNGVALTPGELLIDFRGDELVFKRASAVTEPGKAGKLYVTKYGDDRGYELYCTSFKEKIHVEHLPD